MTKMLLETTTRAPGTAPAGMAASDAETSRRAAAGLITTGREHPGGVMNEPTEEQLMSYADGVLDAETARWVATCIAGRTRPLKRPPRKTLVLQIV